MENTVITYNCRPELKRPIFIEGLPGVGAVGKVAADFLAEKLNATLLADILSEDLPTQIFLDEECVAQVARNEVWFVKDVNGHDLIFLLGEHQGSTTQGQYILTKFVFDKILPYDPSLIITLGGYGTGNIVTEPRVLGCVSDSKLKSRFEEHGVGFYPDEPAGGIVGAAAMFVAFGKEYGIDSICIMGETPGMFVDHKSAKCVVDVLASFLGIEIDTSDMQDEIDQIDEINKQAQDAVLETPKEDLSYFG